VVASTEVGRVEGAGEDLLLARVQVDLGHGCYRALRARRARSCAR
jgi:hypothetical protein